MRRIAILLVIATAACSSAPDKEQTAREKGKNAQVADSISVATEAPKLVNGVAYGVVGGVVESNPITANYAAIAENDFIDTRKEHTTTFSIRSEEHTSELQSR